MPSKIFEKIIDSDDILVLDAGFDGKKFEDVLLKAFSIIGLKFTPNTKNGKGWDFRPQGKNWLKLLDGKNINIKVAKTKWLFGGAEFGSAIDWDNFDNENEDKNRATIKKLLAQNGVSKLLFLRPKDIAVQKEIIQATKDKDKKLLTNLLVKKNFGIKKLGNSFDVKFLTNEKRINSIVIMKDGKVFMRAERPRKVGGSKKFVAFKKDSIIPPKQPRKIINKSEDLIFKANLILGV